MNTAVAICLESIRKHGADDEQHESGEQDINMKITMALSKSRSGFIKQPFYKATPLGDKKGIKPGIHSRPGDLSKMFRLKQGTALLRPIQPEEGLEYY